MIKTALVLELFFNQPTKRWHFEQIIEAVDISRPQAAYWLKKFAKEKLVKRVKQQGKMPYYLGNYEHPNYQTKKRLFALQKMDVAGFLNHLTALPNAQTVIIFGSFARWDWRKDSDIDLFVYGNDAGLEQCKYELKLRRDIQVFTAKNKEELKKFRPALLRNILEGYRVKGRLDFVEVEAHA